MADDSARISAGGWWIPGHSPVRCAQGHLFLNPVEPSELTDEEHTALYGGPR